MMASRIHMGQTGYAKQSKATQGSKPPDSDRELDRLLASDSLRDIVIPPRPELLVARRAEMDKENPDSQTTADIVGR